MRLRKIVAIGVFFSACTSVYALNATLTLSQIGTTDNVTITATGDPSANITLYYSTIMNTTQSAIIGTTDSYGAFSKTINTTEYKLDSNVPVYVIINGQVSPTQVWPYKTIAPAKPLELGEKFISIYAGKSSTVPISGAGPYYVSTVTNPGVVGATIESSSLILSALSVGTAGVIVCQSSEQCGTVNVTVNTPISTSTEYILFNPILSVGQKLTMLVTGGSYPYKIAKSASAIFSATLSERMLTIQGLSPGADGTKICSLDEYSCTYLYVTVTGSPVVKTTPKVTSVVAKTTKGLTFRSDLRLGSKGEEVEELIKKLKKEGYYTGNISTNYTGDVESAVKKYQKAKGLPQLGIIGPATRAVLNK
jgi:hypothetical protein